MARSTRVAALSPVSPLRFAVWQGFRVVMGSTMVSRTLTVVGPSALRPTPALRPVSNPVSGQASSRVSNPISNPVSGQESSRVRHQETG